MPTRSRAVRLALVMLAALVALFVVLALLLTPGDPLPGVDIEPAPASEFFSQEEIARGDAYFDAVKWPGWIGLAVSLAVALALGFTRVGRRLVGLVRSRLRHWTLQVVALVVAVLVIGRLATLPFSIWSTSVSRDYGLVTQSWGDWALDRLKGLGISIVLTSLGLLALVWLARRFTRAWFIPAAAGAGALVIGMSFAYPVVIEPIFNKFTPMPDTPLRAELFHLADEDGLEVSEVLVADASRRTTALNAYVSGFGATKRIVVYDNMLEVAPDDEVALIVAHELGHAKERDVLVGTLLGSVAAMIAMVGLFLVLRPERLRRGVGAGSVGDPAIVPVVLALAAVVGLAVAPIENSISRRIEARADAHSLELTQDPETFIAMQHRLAVTNISHLDPNPVLSFWFRSHPETLERIAMALAWEEQYADEADR